MLCSEYVQTACITQLNHHLTINYPLYVDYKLYYYDALEINLSTNDNGWLGG